MLHFADLIGKIVNLMYR